MADSSSLIAAIDKLVEEKTFNLEAVLAINELRKKAEALEREKDALTRKVDQQLDDLNKGNHEIIKRDSIIGEKTKEIEVFKAREQKAFEAIQHAAVAGGVAEAYKDALKTVFAPTVMRETVYKNKSVPVANPGGYISQGNESENTTIERREDTK